ncbi:flavin-dependent monooxygenase QhpG [Pseudomonas nitroreducens]|uniref:Protein CbrA n=1 Tax=Pseudomonas nitroreducens TaxID=46680 RepID=A0A6G6J7H8_PSENT|nr:FAD-dependent monooxygenase [Pseudomonas nitroreducens]QIE91204.1 FAD-dependent oxidoreductase [Pseudomonas nitroreducens]
MSAVPIVVLGAGPAGAAVAIGLRRLGYDVCVVSEWRRFSAVEGVSARVLEGLRRAGLSRAFACAGSASSRQVRWNEITSVRNQEFLLDRSRLDAALREDMCTAGVRIVEARALKVDSSEAGHRILLEWDGAQRWLEGDFLVEARGRQAPLGRMRLRGPETVTLLNQWHEDPGRCASAVESLVDGWSWMARLPDGRCFWQLSLDAKSASLPMRDNMEEYCIQRRLQSELSCELFGSVSSEGVYVHARSSTATLALETGGGNWLRVGDAAMAVDPLSGNGIFQALSSAMQAPAVINTILTCPERSRLALDFHQQRVEHLFLRFARTGRDFYSLEQHWATEGFWAARSSWPDAEPLHAAPRFSSLEVRHAPVLKDNLVEEAEVVVSEDQSLGMWHLNGIELAPRVLQLQSGQDFPAVSADLTEAQAAMLLAWLRSQGFLAA